MYTLGRFMSTVSRCANLWRSARLDGTGLNACDQPYLFYICRHPACSQDELCRALFVNKSSVTRRLTHLEREGYVTRTQSETDRRTLLVSPTEKALAVRPLLAKMAGEWNTLITTGFSEAEVAQFSALLERAMENAKNGVKELTE